MYFSRKKNIMNSTLKRSFNFLNDKFAILFTLFTILLFSFISLFNFPSADDFDIIVLVNKLGYKDAQLSYYQNWTGRFISTAILFLMSKENFVAYRSFPIALLFLLFLSFYCVVKSLFKSDIKTQINVTCYLFLFFLLTLPTISEGLYWWSGAITYQLANIFTLFLASCLVTLLKKRSLTHTLMGCLFGFLAVGCNETSLILIVSSLSLLILLKYFSEYKFNKQLLAILFCCFVSGAIVYFAPGNNTRASTGQNHNFIFSLLMGMADTSRLTFRWIGPIILVSTLILSETLKKNDRPLLIYLTEKFRLYKLSIFIIPLFLSLFVGFWFLQAPIPTRATNTVFLYLILATAFIIIALAIKSKNVVYLLKTRHIDIALKIVLISILFNQKNMVNAIDDVARLRVFEYKTAWEERTQIVKESKNQQIIQFSPLKKVPKSLFVNDFQDKYYPYNICYARYIGVEAIEVCY